MGMKSGLSPRRGRGVRAEPEYRSAGITDASGSPTSRWSPTNAQPMNSPSCVKNTVPDTKSHPQPYTDDALGASASSAAAYACI